MVKVIGVSGSPRPEGNTEILVRNALKAAETEGAQTEIILLSEKKVLPCTACGACSSGSCIIDDDFEEVFEKITGADGLIFASPSYFESMTPQMKALIDRSGSFNSAAYGRTKFDGKVAGAMSVARRTGLANVWTQLLLFILSQKMIVPGIKSYANAIAQEKGEVLKDKEGMESSWALGLAVTRLAEKLK
ncbi:flavodoxin family protein [Candidatus Bathyarchaeota archaeon]|nr:flavodoxin family protein [Candidatus Bathyarchaeota archaeon]